MVPSGGKPVSSYQYFAYKMTKSNGFPNNQFVIAVNTHLLSNISIDGSFMRSHLGGSKNGNTRQVLGWAIKGTCIYKMRVG